MLNGLKICIPTLHEQQKIASCLSSLEKKIDAETKKLEILNAHKKGLLQELFPKEGKSVPGLRFQGFCGEWEEKKLKKVLNFKYGVGNTNPHNGGEYPIYGANGIIGGYTEFNAENSIIIGHMGATGSVLLEKRKHFVTYNGTITTLKNSNELDIIFTFNILCKLDISKTCVGSGYTFLSYEMLNGLKICIPTLPEQQKIASFLSSLDTLIEAQAKRIALLKKHKKGLMQQLFPK